MLQTIFLAVSVRVGWSLSSQIALFLFVVALQMMKLFSLLSTVDLTLSVQGLTARSITPPSLCRRGMP